MLAVRTLVKQAKTLNIAGEQLGELKERGEAAERDLSATLDRAYELVLLPVAREGLEGPYGFEEVDLSARMGLGRNVHDRVLEGLSSHVFDTITPTKLSTLLGLGDSDGARPFVSCEEVVAAAFSYLQFPKLRSDVPLRDAIAAGAMKGAFGYASAASVEGETLSVAAERVWIGRPTGPDEIDLGAGTYLLAPSLAREKAGRDETSVPTGEDNGGGSGLDGGGTGEIDRGRAAIRGQRLRVELRAGKTEVFDALRILPALSDRSETLEITLRVDAEASDDFDQTWVRNAIREPLEEAGIKADVVVEGDEAPGENQDAS